MNILAEPSGLHIHHSGTIHEPECATPNVDSVGTGARHDVIHSVQSSPSEPQEPYLRAKQDIAGPSPTHRCTIDGCNYRKPFARRKELERHIATKHSRDKPFVCPVLGCFKGQRAPAFARADKLTAHIRAVHSPDSLTTCPFKECGVQLPLWLLGVHSGHRQYDRWSNEISAAISNAASPVHTGCPYWRCRRRLRLNGLIDHILGHTPEEQTEMEWELKKLHYVFERSGTVDDTDAQPTDESSSPSASDHIVAVRVICPVCQHKCEDRKVFATHLIVTHIMQRSAEAHRRFDTRIKPRLIIEGNDESIDRQTRRIEHTLYDWLACIRGSGSKCPLCDGFPYTCTCKTSPLIRSEEEIIQELRPHRQQILRLFPAFVKLGSVFSDVL